MVKNRVISIISLSMMVLFLLPSTLNGFESPGHDDNDLVLPSSIDDTILIEGDSAFNTSNGISSGSGTANDPYVIENKTIEVTDTVGIMIANTTKHLLIRNCTVSGNKLIWIYSISLINTTNVLMSHLKIEQVSIGINVIDSSFINIYKMDINNNTNGISISNSDNITINNTRFENNSVGIQVTSVVDLNIQNLYCYNNSAYGVGFRSVDRVIFSNNSLFSNYVGLTMPICLLW